MSILDDVVAAEKAADNALRRTVICHSSMAEALREEVEREGLSVHVKVTASDSCPKDKAYITRGWPGEPWWP